MSCHAYPTSVVSRNCCFGFGFDLYVNLYVCKYDPTIQEDIIVWGNVLFLNKNWQLISQLFKILSFHQYLAIKLNICRFFGGYEHSIYFVYSFLFLVVRSLAVSLTASKVHAASIEPAHALYDVSSANYCVEVRTGAILFEKSFVDQLDF